MILEAIKNFPRQFEFEPVVENADHLVAAKKFVVAGMGGSHLAADLIKTWNPSLDLVIHSDYGLPPLADEAASGRLYIASSYSGNTEEVIDFFKKAIAQKLPVAAVSIGGKLLRLANESGTPFIQMPDASIEPRSALGYSAVSLLKLMGEERGLEEAKNAAKKLDITKAESEGLELAGKLKGLMPIIYASSRNSAIAYNWKIRFNETGKIPAFSNVFPEMNHNEINGFDATDEILTLSKKFYFLFLKDTADHPRVKLRMDILREMYAEHGLATEEKILGGESVWQKIFQSLLVADWASYYIAKNYGADPEAVEFVEKFKKMIKERGGEDE